MTAVPSDDGFEQGAYSVTDGAFLWLLKVLMVGALTLLRLKCGFLLIYAASYTLYFLDPRVCFSLKRRLAGALEGGKVQSRRCG